MSKPVVVLYAVGVGGKAIPEELHGETPEQFRKRLQADEDRKAKRRKDKAPADRPGLAVGEGRPAGRGAPEASGEAVRARTLTPAFAGGVAGEEGLMRLPEILFDMEGDQHAYRSPDGTVYANASPGDVPLNGAPPVAVPTREEFMCLVAKWLDLTRSEQLSWRVWEVLGNPNHLIANMPGPFRVTVVRWEDGSIDASVADEWCPQPPRLHATATLRSYDPMNARGWTHIPLLHELWQAAKDSASKM